MKKVIKGQTIDLIKGVRYVASRPMAQRGVKFFNITIARVDTKAVVVTLDAMGYDEANRFINAFNNGRSSFDGRIWR